jgi:hypothetical protein
MKDVAELLTAIGSLIGSVLWPGIIIVAFYLYHAELRGMMRRVKKGKLLGQEFEFDQELDKLQQVAVEAKQAQPVLEYKTAEDPQLQIALKEAMRSPRIALMALSAEIEAELRNLVASVGTFSGGRYEVLPLAKALLGLTRKGVPLSIVEAAQLFSDVRNRVVHGRYATDEDAIRAFDSGINILNAIKAVPHEIHTVKTMITVYADAQCTQPRAVQGVMLVSKHTKSLYAVTRVFPTTMTYLPGQRVAWEWDMEKSLGETWYKDPDTGNCVVAWSTSTYFAGRVLD